jgi:hypothetical protein
MSTSEGNQRDEAMAAYPDADMQLAIAKGYEPHDVKLRGIVIFTIVLGITILIALGVSWVIVQALDAANTSHDQAASPYAQPSDAPMPTPLQPSPPHQKLDSEDVQEMRETAWKALTSSGITETGRKYISIDSAIEQVSAKGVIETRVTANETTMSPFQNGGGGGQ